jgi:hypothetical protein
MDRVGSLVALKWWGIKAGHQWQSSAKQFKINSVGWSWDTVTLGLAEKGVPTGTDTHLPVKTDTPLWRLLALERAMESGELALPHRPVKKYSCQARQILLLTVPKLSLSVILPKVPPSSRQTMLRGQVDSEERRALLQTAVAEEEAEEAEEREEKDPRRVMWEMTNLTMSLHRLKMGMLLLAATDLSTVMRKGMASAKLPQKTVDLQVKSLSPPTQHRKGGPKDQGNLHWTHMILPVDMGAVKEGLKVGEQVMQRVELLVTNLATSSSTVPAPPLPMVVVLACSGGAVLIPEVEREQLTIMAVAMKIQTRTVMNVTMVSNSQVVTGRLFYI